MERINRRNKESTIKAAPVPSVMSTSMIVTSSNSSSTITAAPEANGVAKDPVEQLAAELPVPDAVIAVSKAEKEALNNVKTEQVQQQQQVEQQQLLQLDGKTQNEQVSQPIPEVASINVDEKADEGNEKPQAQSQPQSQPQPLQQPQIPQESKKTLRNGSSKENSEVRELTPPSADGNNDLMTASMIAKKITTEEEAKAALAERRRLAREEAERQAELERQRLEAERLAELKAQEEEAERQRLFEEESTRLAEQQRRGEEERLRKAIEVGNKE